jgi:hypothetical protein
MGPTMKSEKGFVERPKPSRHYVLDQVLKLNPPGAIPGGDIEKAAWRSADPSKWPQSPNRLYNLIDRLNRMLRRDGGLQWLSTTYWRKELYPGEKDQRR